MRLVFFLTAGMAWCHNTQAQPSFWLTKQSQVDSVQILYPGIEQVGNLIVGYINYDTTHTDIHDLYPLSSIKKIWGDLYVRNNPRLKNLHGLENVDTIWTPVHTHIRDNDSLENLQGLNDLKLVNNFFVISGNPRLTSLDGLGNLKQADYLTIENNASLESLTGLSSLQTVTYNLSIHNNALQDVNLTSLRRVGTLFIFEEPYLADLDGMSTLDSVGNFSFTGGWLTISKNPMLSNLDGLAGIEMAHSADLSISENASLKSLSALETIQADTMGSVSIISNPLVPNIHLPKLFSCKSLNVIENNALQSLEFPNLQYVIRKPTNTGSLIISGNPSLIIISIPELKEVGEYEAGGGQDKSFIIEKNHALTNLGEWGSFSVIGDMTIQNNGALESLEGLENLKSVGGTFVVRFESSLSSLCEFAQFDSVGEYIGIYCPLLTTLEGVESLNFVGKGLSIGNDSLLADVTAISHIDSIGWNLDTFDLGGITIVGCPSLESINSLSGFDGLSPFSQIAISQNPLLETIKFENVKTLKRVFIRENPSLQDINFPSLTKVGPIYSSYRGVFLRDLPLISSLDGFSNIELLKDSMEVKNNPLLTDCSAICRMLDRGVAMSRFKLSGNDFPCNSILEINEHICDTLTAAHQLPGRDAGMALLLMPNPTEGNIYLQLPEDRTPVTVNIWGASGRQVLHATGGAATYLDIQHLSTGFYFIKVTDNLGRLYQGKIVKQ